MRYFIIIFCVYNCAWAQDYNSASCTDTERCWLYPDSNIPIQCGHCVQDGYGPPYYVNPTWGCVCGAVQSDYVNDGAAPTPCHDNTQFDCSAPSGSACCTQLSRKCCPDPTGGSESLCAPPGVSCYDFQSTVAEAPPCYQCLRGWSPVDRGCDAVAYDAAKCQQCCAENHCTTCPSPTLGAAATLSNTDDATPFNTDDLARTYGVAIGIPLGSAFVFAFGYTYIHSPRVRGRVSPR